MSNWSDRVLAAEATKAGSANEDNRLISNHNCNHTISNKQLINRAETIIKTAQLGNLSRSRVHNSPPRHASINIYRYLLSLNVRYSL